MITKMLFVTRRAKMPLQGVLPLPPIKSRRTPENAVQRIYINFGNTKLPKVYAVGGQHTIIYICGGYITEYLYIYITNEVSKNR